MSERTYKPNLKARRAELLVELFLEEFKPAFISRAADDLGYDILVGFPNRNSGTNTFAVEVKATDRPVGHLFRMPRGAFDRLANSNIPTLLLVADVKRNILYSAWLRAAESHRNGEHVSVPLTRIDERAKAILRKQLASPDEAALATAR